MKDVTLSSVGEPLKTLLQRPGPLADDIAIRADNGELLGVVICARDYSFLLSKVEEAEDRLDQERVAQFHRTRE
ncbi:hypothetical protein [Gallaecimonas xiamenensis]|uniref:Prevent-host-death family protein n=1 Tax=Gallaecimonas xiamenensis 3-C-1 TaxID=745411 RepID=K2J1Z2_9GAMM|nr:hypothetical protein [Gallaecimonas xiamenensis]EKE76996.1 hypothetical protein B3C1_02285 [Gallaecimonas xiamenensis 3-C-1]